MFFSSSQHYYSIDGERNSMPAETVSGSRQIEHRLWIGLGLACGITILEFSGGILSHSLALVSDSAHILTDVITFGLSILSIRLARMPHSQKRTYGWHRAEIFAALVNGGILAAIGVFIIYEAYNRFQQPSTVHGTLVIGVALIALVANLSMMRLFQRTWKTSLNIKGVFLHAVSDVLSSTGVIVSGVVIYTVGFQTIDPIIAALIGILIFKNASGLIRDSTDILMEAIPKHLDLATITRTIQHVPGVRGVHDLHVWTITSGLYAVSGHVTVTTRSMEEGSKIIQEISDQLRTSFGIDHVTIQLEHESLEKIQKPDD
jgi:cobalt-zinc-cadmium efflux system protein